MSKIEKALKMVALVLKVANSVDLDAIQRKYNFTGNRNVRFHVLDAGTHYTFRLSNGKLKLLSLPRKPDVQVYMQELCTLKHLREGYKCGYNPTTKQKFRVSYSPWDAYRYNDVSCDGDSSTNDMLAFLDVFIDLMRLVNPDDVRKIIGSCPHDIDKIEEKEAILPGIE